MLPHFHIERRPNLNELPAIRENFHQKGGRAVLYPQVTSAFLISFESCHLKWVPPWATRTGCGLRFALWTALFGWWSLSGLWCAPAAILSSLCGGIDVTEILRSGQTKISAVTKAQGVFRDRGYYILILELLLLFGGVLFWIAHTPVLPPVKPGS